MDWVQKVMPAHQDDADGKDRPHWQIHQYGQNHHADTNGPDYLNEMEAEMDIKGPAKVDNH